MKKIAILIPSFTIEYCYRLLQGITEFYADKDVQLLILQTKYGKYSLDPLDYQYWVGMGLIDIEEIDAVIVLSGAFCSIIPEKKFIEEIKKCTHKPVISIAVKLSLENSYNVRINSNDVYQELVRHLKTVHHCKKIAFLSAAATTSPEAIERFDSFKKALKDNNLEFYPELVYEGKFSTHEMINVLSKKLKSVEDIKFDSIISSNDNMAIGAYEVLKKLKVRIPEDVKIIGFDDTTFSRFAYPKLSTVNQDFLVEGYQAALIAQKIINKENIPQDNYKKLEIKYRQSCGCIKKNNSASIFKNRENKVCTEYEKIDYYEDYIANLNEKNNLMKLMDILRSSNTLRQLFYKLKYIIEQCDMSEMYVYLYKEPIYSEGETKVSIPEEIELYMYINNFLDKTEFRPGLFLKTKEIIASSKLFSNEKGNFVIQPIFSGEMNYGFIACKVEGTKFADYDVNLYIVCKEISQAYEYTDKIIQTEKIEAEKNSLLEKNMDLKLQSHTDELTKIYNRRGFLDVGQKSLDVMQELNTAGCIFFADMDGLKIINDQYGHSMGDIAIKLQAQVLKKVFSQKDIVGRLSGDEFGIVALGMLISEYDNINRKIEEENRRISKENELPFILSISLGVVDLSSSTDLKGLLKEADKNLYVVKNSKHKNRRLDIHYE